MTSMIAMAPLPSLASLQSVPGFESTAYAYLNGKLVWAGGEGVSAHPRHAASPWFPELKVYDAIRLKSGAQTCLAQITSSPLLFAPVKGLLLWLVGHPLAFPLLHAQKRFDAVRLALETNDLQAFESAALRVLGLGDGLTPSGDDFVGSIFFALAHAPRQAWAPHLEGVKTKIRAAAKTATNPISAALLDDLIDGASHRALHDMLDAMASMDAIKMEASYADLMRLGASSGADMLAGLLLALASLNLTC